MIDVDKLNYLSLHSIDKVVMEGTISIVNSGATSFPQGSLIVSETITNTYGRKAFARASWSIDSGVSYQSLESQVTYSFLYNTVAPAPVTSTPLRGLKAAVSIGVSDTLVTFRTANGFHGTVTDDGTTISYTPTSQTFIIKYAIFERE